MLAVAWTLARAAGWARWVFLAACTALVSGLLLIAVALLLVRGDARQELIKVAADPGTRGGVVLTVVLLVVPPLLLLDQVVRLGTASRHRRHAALRIAGATPSDVRRLGAIEIGIPTTIGAAAGVLVYFLFRAVLRTSRVGIVPTSVTPSWWQIVAAVVAVSVLGVAIGWHSSRHVIHAPLDLTRRSTTSPPRPWGVVPIVVAVALIPFAFMLGHSGDVLLFTAVALTVLGASALAPWVAHRAATFVHARATTAATLLASARIVADPRPAGRAAAAVGGIALVGGGNASFLAIVIEPDFFESFHVINSALVSIALLAALLVTAGSMAVHSVESLFDRRREMSFLAAIGLPRSELDRARRQEVIIVALPLAILGSLAGAIIIGALNGEWSIISLVIAIVGVALTLLCVWLAAITAVRAVRPWARQTARPTNLRTE